MSAKIFNSPRLMDVMALIAAERIRQKQLLRDGKILFNCDSPVVSYDRKLRILVEEIGEVAEAIDLLETCRPGYAPSKRMKALLRAELIQVATVAVAWLETQDVKS